MEMDCQPDITVQSEQVHQIHFVDYTGIIWEKNIDIIKIYIC